MSGGLLPRNNIQMQEKPYVLYDLLIQINTKNTFEKNRELRGLKLKIVMSMISDTRQKNNTYMTNQ